MSILASFLRTVATATTSASSDTLAVIRTPRIILYIIASFILIFIFYAIGVMLAASRYTWTSRSSFQVHSTGGIFVVIVSNPMSTWFTNPASAGSSDGHAWDKWPYEQLPLFAHGGNAVYLATVSIGWPLRFAHCHVQGTVIQ